MDYLLLVAGLAILLLAADFLVDSSVAIAQKAHISNFIIGLTIVGMGTSAPELFISIKSALSDAGDVAVGNVLGSNIANIFLILGVTAIIMPFAIERTTQRRDIPVGIGAAVLLLLLANDNFFPGLTPSLNRLDGITFLLIFLAYMGYVVVGKGKNPKEALEDAEEQSKSKFTGKNTVLLVVIAIASFAGLIFGGNLFLDSAKSLARSWGMTEAVISITIVAVGTSLPELITAIVAATKKNPQLALGNVLGSNVFNILMILGLSATIKPLAITDINIVDFLMVLLAAVLTYVVVFTFGKKRFDRIEGVIFVVLYIGYTIYLLLR